MHPRSSPIMPRTADEAASANFVHNHLTVRGMPGEDLTVPMRRVRLGAAMRIAESHGVSFRALETVCNLAQGYLSRVKSSDEHEVTEQLVRAIEGAVYELMLPHLSLQGKRWPLLVDTPSLQNPDSHYALEVQRRELLVRGDPAYLVARGEKAAIGPRYKIEGTEILVLDEAREVTTVDSLLRRVTDRMRDSSTYSPGEASAALASLVRAGIITPIRSLSSEPGKFTHVVATCGVNSRVPVQLGATLLRGPDYLKFTIVCGFIALRPVLTIDENDLMLSERHHDDLVPLFVSLALQGALTPGEKNGKE